MEALSLKPFPRPACGLTGTEMTSIASHHETPKAPPHILINSPELLGGIPGAKVVAPPTQHGIQVRDHDAHILHPLPLPVRQVLQARTHPPHTPCRWPSL